MKCARCQRENSAASRFCIFCGSPLYLSGSVTPSQPPSSLNLEEEVRRLKEIVAAMSVRLSALERQQGIAPAPPVPVPPPVAPPQETVPAAGMAAPTPPAPPPEQAAPGKPREWEQALGGNWLARIGILALIIGVGFFFKLAFDNEWIGPAGRVILGIVAGIGMLGLGHYWLKKYPALAQAISGGGIALLYISIVSAFAAYKLLDLLPAFGFLVLVSLTSAALALRYEAMALAIIAVLGAFTAPFILGAFERAGPPSPAQAGPGIQMLAYILVVDVGVLALSTFRNWRWFTLLALFGSLAAFGIWNDRYGVRVVGLAITEVGLSIMFLIFVGATTLYHIVWRRAAEDFDQALMIINAGTYFGISWGIMGSRLEAWMGGFSLLLALFYAGLAYTALKRSTENVRLSFFALGIALVFLTTAIPVQLGNRAWTTVAWAAEGAVLMWLSFTLRMPRVSWYSYAVFFITAIRLVFFDTWVDLRTFQPVLNERFLAFSVSIAAVYVTRYMLRHTGGRKTEAVVFLAAANFFSIWLLSAEVVSYFDTLLIAQRSARLPTAGLLSARSLSLTVVWALYAVALIVVGIARQSRALRLGGLGLLVIPVGKLFISDVFTLELVYRIIAFIGLGVLLLVSAYLYQRYGKAIRGFLVEK